MVIVRWVWVHLLQNKHEWTGIGCMDQMTISPGLKWLSCFDKLAYMVTTGDYQTKAV